MNLNGNDGNHNGSDINNTQNDESFGHGSDD